MCQGQHCTYWKRYFVIWCFGNEGHDLATGDHANLPYPAGVKVCIYTVSPEYGEYVVTRRAPLPNLLRPDGIPNANPAHPFWRGSPRVKNDGGCGLNTVVLPQKYDSKYGTLWTLPSFAMATHSPVRSSVSCTLTVVGCCHNQPARCETCAAGFTTKWTPQYRRPQTKPEIRQSICCPLDMSRGCRICCRIYTYNYMQYTAVAYRLRAHFPSQHELGPRTPPLDDLTTFSWHGRNTCVWCSAPSALYRSAANRQAPERRHA